MAEKLSNKLYEMQINNKNYEKIKLKRLLTLLDAY